MIDLLLALGHHFLVFTLAALLIAEVALLRPGLDRREMRRLGALDIAYGMVAMLVLAVGFGRVFFGARGPEFFLTNVWFWAKVSFFIIGALLSAPPTLRFAAWRKRARRDTSFALTAGDVQWVRRFMVAEVVVFAFVPLFAAAMVRVPFL